jgi:4'-phosphopantetheinyl transferase
MPAPEVHIACARTGDIAPEDWLELDDWLDERERARALRFRFEEDRNSYVLAHALRRALVARVTGMDAASIRFSHTAQGQPLVKGEPLLNISNSATRAAAACAVTLAGPVGIDVETVDVRKADMELLASFVVSAPSQAGGREFFMQWALLEAFWKAWGTGLAQDNSRIVVSPLERGRFDIRTEGYGSSIGGTGWALESFDNCATALVLRGRLHEALRFRQTRCNSAMEVKQLSSAILAI